MTNNEIPRNVPATFSIIFESNLFFWFDNNPGLQNSIGRMAPSPLANALRRGKWEKS